jgi:hypothetical protein
VARAGGIHLHRAAPTSPRRRLLGGSGESEAYSAVVGFTLEFDLGSGEVRPELPDPATIPSNAPVATMLMSTCSAIVGASRYSVVGDYPGEFQP